jgi:hypothetical protein
MHILFVFRTTNYSVFDYYKNASVLSVLKIIIATWYWVDSIKSNHQQSALKIIGNMYLSVR